MRNPDQAHLSLIASLPVRPIMIMGLHRSGTTYLYDVLSEILNVATLNVYHIRHYPELLDARASGREQALQDAIDGDFARQGLDTRQTDAIRLSHATVEEYGWILQRRGGSFRVGPRTAPLFGEICRKISFLNPGAQAVLMKNPWDTGNAAEILKSYPETRFVYIRRDPAGILNSQLRNAIHFGSRRDPVLYFLLEGIPAGKAVIGGQRVLYKLVGERAYRRLLVDYLARDVRRELAKFAEATSSLPRDKFIEIEYESLMERPQEVLGKVCAFLGMTPANALANVRPEPRKLKLLPEVEERAAALRALVKTG